MYIVVRSVANIVVIVQCIVLLLLTVSSSTGGAVDAAEISMIASSVRTALSSFFYLNQQQEQPQQPQQQQDQEHHVSTTNRRVQEVVDSIADSPKGVYVSNLYLINTETNATIMELRNGTTYDTNIIGTALSIQATVQKDNTFVNNDGKPLWIEFSLNNGDLVRTDMSEPHTLGEADPDTGKLYPSETIARLGKHTLKVTPLIDGKSLSTSDVLTADGSLMIEFEVHQGSIPIPPPIDKPTDVEGIKGALPVGLVSGALKTYHKVTVSFTGPVTSELGSSERGPMGPLGTFRDYRADVTFVHQQSNKKMVIPAYFALNGDAANSQTNEGSIWLVHLVPDVDGDWDWTASFKMCPNCATADDTTANKAASAQYFDGISGTFTVEQTADVVIDDNTTNSNDLRYKGKLTKVGTSSYLQWSASKEYHLMMGPDSPSNLLAYEDFVGTTNNNGFLKSYVSHKSDYQAGNVTWNNGNGTGLIGAINYLASKKMNIISACSLTINGTDNNIHPFYALNYNDNDMESNYNVHKLTQWGAFFDYTERVGMALRLKLQDDWSDDLSTKERHLYYREMIARFGHHLGMIYDLGQDISILDIPLIKARAELIRKLDPYDSPIMLATTDDVYDELRKFTMIDIVEVSGDNPTKRYDNNNNNWVVAMKYSGIVPNANEADLTAIRTAVWSNVMSGGSGTQFKFYDDLTIQDYRTQETTLTQAGHVLNFFTSNAIPFQDMKPSIAANDDVLLLKSINDSIIVAYKKPGTSTSLQMTVPGSSYKLSWYNPRTGETSTTGLNTISSGDQALAPPTDPTLDWVSLLQKS